MTRKCARCGKPFRKSKDYPKGGPVFHYRDQTWPLGVHVYAHGYCKGLPVTATSDGFQHPLQPACLVLSSPFSASWSGP